jgi:hypothetical protein
MFRAVVNGALGVILALAGGLLTTLWCVTNWATVSIGNFHGVVRLGPYIIPGWVGVPTYLVGIAMYYMAKQSAKKSMNRFSIPSGRRL